MGGRFFILLLGFLFMFKLERQVFVQNQLDEDYYDDYEEDEEGLTEGLDEEIPEEDEL